MSDTLYIALGAIIMILLTIGGYMLDKAISAFFISLFL